MSAYAIALIGAHMWDCWMRNVFLLKARSMQEERESAKESISRYRISGD